jgi:hypothetical protein
MIYSRIPPMIFVVAIAASGQAFAMNDSQGANGTTAEDCNPQPQCRAIYTTMQPSRKFGPVMAKHHMMHHKHTMKRHAM